MALQAPDPAAHDKQIPEAPKRLDAAIEAIVVQESITEFPDPSGMADEEKVGRSVAFVEPFRRVAQHIMAVDLGLRQLDAQRIGECFGRAPVAGAGGYVRNQDADWF